MDRLQKFLAKLNPARREKVISILERLGRGHTEGLDIMSLKGMPGHFRVRTGDIHILCFRQNQSFVAYELGFRGGIYKD
jgi:hypothetical protein